MDFRYSDYADKKVEKNYCTEVVDLKKKSISFKVRNFVKGPFIN